MPRFPEYLGVHDKDKHTDRTRKIFIPYSGFVNATEGVWSGFAFIVLDAAAEEVYGSLAVPEDYLSGGKLYLVYLERGLSNAAGTLYAKFGASGEAAAAHFMNSGELTIPNTEGGTDDYHILEMLTLTGLAKNDFIGMYLVYNSIKEISVFGFLFQYTADM